MPPRIVEPIIQERHTLEADPTERVRTTYDALASLYDERWNKYISLSLSEIISVLSLQGCERILDVACGTGELERRLFAKWPGLHITGVDLSPKMLAQARAKHIKGDVTWIEGSAAVLPFPNGQFDIVVCANSFHYFRNPLGCLREFRRCLAPDGNVILVDWCDDYLICKICSIWLKLTDPAFFCTYTMRIFRAMFENAGFEVVHSERFKVSWLWGMMLWQGKLADR